MQKFKQVVKCLICVCLGVEHEFFLSVELLEECDPEFVGQERSRLLTRLLCGIRSLFVKLANRTDRLEQFDGGAVTGQLLHILLERLDLPKGLQTYVQEAVELGAFVFYAELAPDMACLKWRLLHVRRHGSLLLLNF